MAEYIEREALLAHLYSEQDEPHDIAAEIAAFPAADAAAVVRCKECRHLLQVFKPEIEKGGGICGKGYETGKVEGYLLRVKADDFCSYGEPKEGAEDG